MVTTAEKPTVQLDIVIVAKCPACDEPLVCNSCEVFFEAAASGKAELHQGLVCEECGDLKAAEDCPPLWECSNGDCGETFVAEDRACPSCNRPFSRKLDAHGCDGCSAPMVQGSYVECQCGEPLKCNRCEHLVGAEQ